MTKLAQLKKVYDELGKKQLKVGFFEHSKYPDGTPIAYVAAIQELGYPEGGIPPRPFLRPTMKNKKTEYGQLIFRVAKAAANGNITVNDGLTQVGAKAASDMKLAIKAVTTPVLDDATVKARARRHSKGKSTNKPLVDTGQMLNAVTFVVEDK
ncbi:TPA: hypothetical protein ACS78B_000145 [Providencia alcalifaciens]|uniref:hypothetical protein n=1 Tax=Providencia alcalifaciens TaxID=126385 RepID=UPI0004539AF5|nr:hypothetical protein [Providencia alcalifaciens]ETT07960.1 hypothetical protein HMPREF1562_0519 [Providencia alcalifaciens F90-2004]MTC37643.1 hypothetical protein [Providencia alcalifaciens]CAG9424407.1 hypothetical protein NVI2019_NGLDDFDA_02377 [Providencia alcalifaciens]HEF8785087.1 hypothetical protein [Providencia alcalifaciens]